MAFTQEQLNGIDTSGLSGYALQYVNSLKNGNNNIGSANNLNSNVRTTPKNTSATKNIPTGALSYTPSYSTYSASDINKALDSLKENYDSSTGDLYGQAQTAAALTEDPVVTQLNAAKKRNELEYYNNLNKAEAATAGNDAALAYNKSQMQRSNRIRSAQSGAGARSGLNDYLNNETDTALASQRLQNAATLNANTNALNDTLTTNNQEIADKLEDAATQRGTAAAAYYNNLVNAQKSDQNDWNKAALNAAVSLGQIQQSLNQVKSADYGNQLNYASNMQQYLTPTAYQAGQLYNDSSNIFGQAPGSLSSQSAQNSNGSAINLRDYAAKMGSNVSWNSNDGSVSVGNGGNVKTYTPSQLQEMGGALVNGRWQIPESAIARIL